jgi:hypothetical protein
MTGKFGANSDTLLQDIDIVSTFGAMAERPGDGYTISLVGT